MPLVTPIIDAPAKGVRRARWGPMGSGDWGGPFHIQNAKSVAVCVEHATTFGDAVVSIRGKVNDFDPDYGHVIATAASHALITVSDAVSNRAVASVHPTVSGTTGTNLFVTAWAKFG